MREKMFSEKAGLLSYLLYLLFGFALFFCCQKACAKFYESHAEGWHWYKNSKDEIEEDDKNKKEISSDPTEQMKGLRTTIQRALDNAVLYPTDSNVKSYIDLQNRLGNQSSLFAEVWQRVLLENPSLNYALIHPTNTLAKQVDLDLQHKREDAAIAKLAQESGLFFFYSSSCAYCRKFAPMLKSFALNYNISVIPITLDGIFLPEFPSSKVDKGQAARFNVTVEPSLFAVNPYTGKAYPVSQGLISEYDLRKRILDLSQNFIGTT
jgi:conjugal transfer pilus assembly protein TraF